MRHARNDEIEIRVDLERSASQIMYRVLADENHSDEIEWTGTPFQRADVLNEDEALSLVDAWLE